MRNQGQVIFGIVVVLIGVLLLIGNIFNVNIWALFWPSLLILAGAWLLARPRMIGPNMALEQKILGEVQREGAWKVSDEEIALLVGDVELDMTRAEIPPGETRIRVLSFVSGVELIVPEGVGVSVSSTAFVTDAKVFGQKQENILAPLRITSDDYETAERKIRLEVTFFAGDVKVKRV